MIPLAVTGGDRIFPPSRCCPGPLVLVRRYLLILIALGAGWFGPAARASTLTPGHPVWSTPGIDHERLRAALNRQYSVRRHPTPYEPGAHKSEHASVRMLVIPVLYADGPEAPPVSREVLQARFFERSRPSSLASFYEVVSGGRWVPQGYVVPWVRLPGTLQSDYPNIVNGAPRPPAGPQALVRDAVRLAARSVDLTWFDADGPDGVPGSGDDDGFIDYLVVLHPDAGFENDPSQSDRAILAHQFVVDPDEELVPGGAAARAYVLASVQGPLGVWAHETAHLLGLPDLHDLDIAGTL